MILLGRWNTSVVWHPDQAHQQLDGRCWSFAHVVFRMTPFRFQRQATAANALSRSSKVPETLGWMAIPSAVCFFSSLEKGKFHPPTPTHTLDGQRKRRRRFLLSENFRGISGLLKPPRTTGLWRNCLNSEVKVCFFEIGLKKQVLQKLKRWR